MEGLLGAVVSVLVGVEQELHAALNASLVLLTDLVKHMLELLVSGVHDRVNKLVDRVLLHRVVDGLDKLLGLLGLFYYSVDLLDYDSNMRRRSGIFHHPSRYSRLRLLRRYFLLDFLELLLGLMEHSLLLFHQLLTRLSI